MALTLVTSATNPLPGETPFSGLYNLPAPATGAEWTMTVPSGQFWQILAVTAEIVASAVATNRVANLFVKTSTTTIYVATTPAAITASQTAFVSWFIGSSAFSNGTRQTAPMPDIILPPGTIVQSSTDNLDTGDAWQATRFFVLVFT